MTAPHPTPDLATLLAALDTAAETITALANCIGREDYEAEKRAMVKVDQWSKLNRRLAYLRGDHRRGMVLRAMEEAA